ncbi:hypothetical protein [Methylobacterium radiotolerans]|uniref:hypothetical protein n=1 Tax=Methylobacterium radiotolerans TaxID=31998 RepID=UPI0010577D7F|nr:MULTISPECIES: hypothetical protein [Methylobacterium]MDE3748625.1 hypothetical protein [Methylobacterium radiotolerans]
MPAHIKIVSDLLAKAEPSDGAPGSPGRRIFWVVLCDDDGECVMADSFDYGQAIIAAHDCADDGGARLKIRDEVI